MRDYCGGKRDGWACIAFAFEEGQGVAFHKDHEHGLCELFRQRGLGFR